MGLIFRWTSLKRGVRTVTLSGLGLAKGLARDGNPTRERVPFAGFRFTFSRHRLSPLGWPGDERKP